jgi:hypothetical protein
MSEPLSSTEIEDVLSSIRRLVSDDMRPVNGKTAAPVGSEKLILTPALRVVLPVGADTEPEITLMTSVAAGEPSAVSAVLPRLHLTLDDSPASGLGQVVASVGAAVNAQPENWDAELDEIVSAEGIPAAMWQSPPEAEADADADSAVELEAAKVSEDDAVAAWAQHDGTDHDADPSEAVVVPGTIEPDAIWAAAAEASVIAALAEDDLPGAGPDADDDAMRFDEDVLRELVRDILREELAGKMGERITRNIRKLVRAEIARALATQDFD